MNDDGILVHLCSDRDWASAQRSGALRPESLDDVGFVHLSTPDQVHLPANRLYQGRTDLILLQVDSTKVGAPVRWEPGVPSDPDSMLFPHLYGPLPTDAVVGVRAYRPRPDGRFDAAD